MVLSVLKHLLDPCLWRLTGRVLWNCLLRVSVAPWKLLALMLIEEEEKRSKKKFNHDCSKHDQNRLTHELVSSDPNQARFTRLHAYGIDDLVDFVICTCCRNDQTKLTETQRQAKEEFVKVFSSDTTDFSKDQLVYLMGLLDKIFFAGSLTQRQPGLVEFEIIPFDPWAWNRVRWRLQEPDFLAYTDYAQPLSKDTLIAMSRVSGGRRFTRTQMITILSHEMCHSFIALYWDWCPEEKKVYVENTMNSHGRRFIPCVMKFIARSTSGIPISIVLGTRRLKNPYLAPG